MKTIEETVRELKERIEKCKTVLKFCDEYPDSLEYYKFKLNTYQDILNFIEVN